MIDKRTALSRLSRLRDEQREAIDASPGASSLAAAHRRVELQEMVRALDYAIVCVKESPQVKAVRS